MNAHRILAIRLDNLGDIIMTGPALRAIKENLPGAEITLLGGSAGPAASTLLPWIDDCMVHRGIWQDIGSGYRFEPEQDFRLIERLRERRFDAAFIFTSFKQTPHVPAYLCYLAGIQRRVGESLEFGGLALTDTVTGTPEWEHQVERNLRLVRIVGMRVDDSRLAVDIPAEEVLVAERRLAELGVERPYIVIHPGATAAARRYPPERFGAVAAVLSARGWPVLLTGSERERDLVEAVAAAAPGARSVAGRTSLGAFAALMAAASLVICNNTLAMHLADALDVPLVALFAGTDRESQWAPRSTDHVLLRHDTPCTPCYRFECPIGQPCLGIAPDQVVAAADRLLSRTGKSEVVA
ncbi:MAG: glycosyltransferase family 9 protein [Chloroflexota bacterium]